MHGFRVFLGKEFAEVIGTWRMWVLPLILVAMAIMSPVLAELTPQMVESMGSETPGTVIQMPEPTTLDSYLQYSKSLSQIILIALIISVAGMVSGERASGTAILMLTNPVSRAGFVLAKLISNTATVVGAAVVGTLACWAVTQIFFENLLVGELLALVGLWVVFATMFVALMALLSVLFESQSGAAGMGLGIYLLLGVLTLWEPATLYTPVGLMGLGDQLLMGGEVSVVWPVVTALAVTVVAAAGAVFAFSRAEI